jgi:hypothetical protein
MEAFRVRAALVGDIEAVVDGDPLDDEDAVLVLDLADGLHVVARRIDFDLTRLQRAGERAGQSAAGCRHDVVQRGRARRELVGRDAVVLRHLGVDAERDRVLLRRR